jgi:hypothetical protein
MNDVPTIFSGKILFNKNIFRTKWKLF